MKIDKDQPRISEPESEIRGKAPLLFDTDTGMGG